jgi:hypothetical protein
MALILGLFFAEMACVIAEDRRIGFLPDKRGFILDVGAGSGRDAALLSAPLSAYLAAYFSPDLDLIPSCHSSNRLRSRQ